MMLGNSVYGKSIRPINNNGGSIRIPPRPLSCAQMASYMERLYFIVHIIKQGDENEALLSTALDGLEDRLLLHKGFLFGQEARQRALAVLAEESSNAEQKTEKLNAIFRVPCTTLFYRQLVDLLLRGTDDSQIRNQFSYTFDDDETSKAVFRPSRTVCDYALNQGTAGEEQRLQFVGCGRTDEEAKSRALDGFITAVREAIEKQ